MRWEWIQEKSYSTNWGTKNNGFSKARNQVGRSEFANYLTTNQSSAMRPVKASRIKVWVSRNCKEGSNKKAAPNILETWTNSWPKTKMNSTTSKKSVHSSSGRLMNYSLNRRWDTCAKTKNCNRTSSEVSPEECGKMLQTSLSFPGPAWLPVNCCSVGSTSRTRLTRAQWSNFSCPINFINGSILTMERTTVPAAASTPWRTSSSTSLTWMTTKTS